MFPGFQMVIMWDLEIKALQQSSRKPPCVPSTSWHSSWKYLHEERDQPALRVSGQPNPPLVDDNSGAYHLPLQMGLLIVLATCSGYRACSYGYTTLFTLAPSPNLRQHNQQVLPVAPQLLSHWLLVVTTFPNPGSPKIVFPNCVPTLSGHILKCTPQPKATLPLLPFFRAHRLNRI